MLLFWFDAFVTDFGINECVCIGIVLIQRTLLVGHICPVNLRSITYDTVWSTNLTIVPPLWTLVFQKFCVENTCTNWWIPERVVAVSQCGSLFLADGSFQVSPIVEAIAGCQEHTCAEQVLLVHICTLCTNGSIQMEPVFLWQTICCADTWLIIWLMTSIPTEIGGNVMLLSESLVEHQHDITIYDRILVVAQTVWIRELTCSREQVWSFCTILILNLIGCDICSDTGTQLQSRDDVPCRVYRTDKASVILFLCLTQDIPEVLWHQRCRTHWCVKELLVWSQGLVCSAIGTIDTIQVSLAGKCVLTDIFNISETTEHSSIVTYQTADTIRTVLDILWCECCSIVQLDGLGNIKCTI